ncbi:MAG: DUF4276 family protein [Methylococcaceae bacterium]|nr:DUF4276 family protein [Methylococcaceae bacterium]
MSNSAIYIIIIVEGKTERTFVEQVLAPTMAFKGIYLTASILGKVGHKGGNISFERARSDIGRFLQQRSDTYISTMFDYFRIDSHWAGKETLDKKVKSGVKLSITEKAATLEDATLVQMKQFFPEYNIEKRFIPYIEMHEFEALLFSDAEILANKLKIPIAQINAILAEYDSPEDINSDPSKAPSKQLEKLVDNYKKVIMGKVISEAIGINTIRQQCLHFNDWLLKLESLSK